MDACAALGLRSVLTTGRTTRRQRDVGPPPTRFSRIRPHAPQVELWDLPSRSLLRMIKYSTSITSMAWYPPKNETPAPGSLERFMIVGSDGSYLFYKVKDQRIVVPDPSKHTSRTFSNYPIACITWCSGVLVAGDLAGTLTYWTAARPRAVPLLTQRSPILKLSVCPATFDLSHKPEDRPAESEAPASESPGRTASEAGLGGAGPPEAGGPTAAGAPEGPTSPGQGTAEEELCASASLDDPLTLSLSTASTDPPSSALGPHLPASPASAAAAPEDTAAPPPEPPAPAEAGADSPTEPPLASPEPTPASAAQGAAQAAPAPTPTRAPPVPLPGLPSQAKAGGARSPTIAPEALPTPAAPFASLSPPPPPPAPEPPLPAHCFVLVLFQDLDFGVWDVFKRKRVSHSVNRSLGRDLRATDVGWVPGPCPAVVTPTGSVMILDLGLATSSTPVLLRSLPAPMASPALMPDVDAAYLRSILLHDMCGVAADVECERQLKGEAATCAGGAARQPLARNGLGVTVPPGTRHQCEEVRLHFALVPRPLKAQLHALSRHADFAPAPTPDAAGDVARRCLLVSQFFGDQDLVRLWRVVMQHFRSKEPAPAAPAPYLPEGPAGGAGPMAEAKRPDSAPGPAQYDVELPWEDSLLFPSAVCTASEQEQTGLRESALRSSGKSHLIPSVATSHVLCGGMERAVELLLSSPPEQPDFELNLYKVCGGVGAGIPVRATQAPPPPLPGKALWAQDSAFWPTPPPQRADPDASCIRFDSSPLWRP